MIYEINSLEVYNAIQEGALFIVNSADGCRSLVSFPITLEGINVLNVYEETLLKNLMNSSDWKQPCIGC